MKRAIIAILIGSIGVSALAVDAFDVATVKQTGPRTGASGKKYLDVEGDANGQYASFGVIDFSMSGHGAQASSLSNLQLSLFDSPAGFSHAGSFDIFVTTDTVTDIQPGTSPLKYMTSDAPGGLGNQLQTTYLLGVGTYNPGNAGDKLTFNLSAAGAAQAYMLAEYNSGANIRLVLTSLTSDGSLTFGGTGAGTTGAPQLTFNANVVPEPASMAVLGLGAIGLVARKRRSR